MANGYGYDGGYDHGSVGELGGFDRRAEEAHRVGTRIRPIIRVKARFQFGSGERTGMGAAGFVATV
jgi:hypothetical protein